MLRIHRCLRCGHEWASHSPHPVRCAKCKTPYWDKERGQSVGRIKAGSEDNEKGLIE